MPAIRGRAVRISFLLLAACGTGENHSSDLAVTRTQLGDTLVVHTRRPAHTDTADLVEVLRIGEFADSRDLVLDAVTAFAVDDSGRVYIADQDGIRIFSGDGRYLRRLARLGQGPGEVRGLVSAMDVDADGRVLAVDYGNRRVNVYETTHDIVETWQLPPGAPGYNRLGLIPAADGSVSVAYNPPMPQSGESESYPRPAFLKLSARGAVIDTVWVGAEWTQQCPYQSSWWWRAGWYEDLRAPYFPRIQWAIGRDGRIVIGCSADYVFVITHADGRIVRVSRDWRPLPATREERAAFVDGWNEQRGSPGGFAGGGWSWRGPEPPEQRPAYLRMFVDPGGRLWVWPPRPRKLREPNTDAAASGWETVPGGAFEVFDTAGVFLGAIRWPAELRYSPWPGYLDPYIRGDTVWAVRFDSLGVEYLSKHVIRWPD